MKIDKKAIKEFAKREMQYNTHDPFEATLRGLETWLEKTGILLISKMEIETIKGLVEVVESKRQSKKLPDEERGEA